jgi:hypothetical protein
LNSARAASARLTEQVAALGRHLERAARTGLSFRYRTR